MKTTKKKRLQTTKIWKATGKSKGKINPKNVNCLKFYDLKKCGLSKQKVKGIRELSKKRKNYFFTYWTRSRLERKN